MFLLDHPLQLILGLMLILSSIGVIALKNPVHASLSFLMTLLVLATIYLQLNAQFISIMQILVYAGAILVLFMFVIILFQDAHKQLLRFVPQSNKTLISIACLLISLTLCLSLFSFYDLTAAPFHLKEGYGTVQSLGKALYTDFFFPFEAVTLLFLVASVGSLYIGKKVK